LPEHISGNREDQTGEGRVERALLVREELGNNCTVFEAFVRRRYTEELEKAQRDLFREPNQTG
jgi:hypothetical protein